MQLSSRSNSLAMPKFATCVVMSLRTRSVRSLRPVWDWLLKPSVCLLVWPIRVHSVPPTHPDWSICTPLEWLAESHLDLVPPSPSSQSKYTARCHQWVLVGPRDQARVYILCPRMVFGNFSKIVLAVTRLCLHCLWTFVVVVVVNLTRRRPRSQISPS